MDQKILYVLLCSDCHSCEILFSSVTFCTMCFHLFINANTSIQLQYMKSHAILYNQYMF